MAIHIRYAKEGKLVEPSIEDCEEMESYEHLMATDTDEDLIIPHEVAAADSVLEKNATYPCPDSTTIPLIISNELVHLMHLSTPRA